MRTGMGRLVKRKARVSAVLQQAKVCFQSTRALSCVYTVWSSLESSMDRSWHFLCLKLIEIVYGGGRRNGEISFERGVEPVPNGGMEDVVEVFEHDELLFLLLLFLWRLL